VLAGLTLAFRVDVGAAAIAGVALQAWPVSRGRAARAVGIAGLVGVALIAPVALAAPRKFWDEVLAFGFRQQKLQRLPLPGAYHGPGSPLKVLEHYFPYVLLVATALWVVAALWRRPPLRSWALAPLAAAGVWYLLARDDEFHYSPLAVVLPILLAGAVVRELRGRDRPGALVLLAVLAVLAIEGLDAQRLQITAHPAMAAIPVDVADGVQAPVADAHAIGGLVRYVRAHVPRGAPVFVAPPRFDRVRVGDPLLYVLMQRPDPTPYDVIQPGVVTTAPVQREIIGDLRRSHTRYVIRWLSPVASQAEPNGSGRSSGVHLLDRWIAANYAPVRRFGDYAVLRLRSG